MTTDEHFTKRMTCANHCLFHLHRIIFIIEYLFRQIFQGTSVAKNSVAISFSTKLEIEDF